MTENSALDVEETDTNHAIQAEASGPVAPTSGLSNHGIARAALVVMLFFVLSRVMGLGREVVIGALYGTSAELDAYLAAFRIPDLLFQLVAGGALGSAFIPTFATHWVKSDRQNAWLLFSRVLNLVTLVLVILAALAAVFALPLVRWIIAPGFVLEQQMLAANLMRWMLVSTVIFGASGLVMGALNATQHFLLPAAAPVMYNGAIIVGAWLLAPRFGIYGLVIGVVAGALLHLLIQLPGLRQYQARYRPSLTLRDPGVREVARLMGPRVLGLFFVQLHFLVNTTLASGLAEGSVSALNYAWLLMLLPQGVFAQAIATAVFPTFAAQVAAQQPDAMRRTFGQTLRMVLFLTIPAAVGLYVLRVPLVQALLERGQFSAESTQMVAFALQFYAIGLVAHATVEIMVRAFYALHDTWTPVVAGIGAMTLNIVLCLWWVGWLGYGGLALANSVATSLEMLVLVWLLRRRMNGLDERRLLMSIVRAVLAAAVMGGAIGLWLAFAGGNAWLSASGGIGVAALTYGAVSLLLKSEELQPALAIVMRR
ncbi:MAG: murein biosynthesis integral membrane protein MurJ [Gammaproteobacteria bacterium]|nr:murein biosynthesis integral membrane protein MurJ [Gammaproteobacteria bacterium]